MNFRDLADGLESGLISVLENGHNTVKLNKRVRGRVSRMDALIAEYQAKILKKAPEKNPGDHENMLLYYRSKLETELKVGSIILDVESECTSCGAHLYAVLIDEHNISYIDSTHYWELAEASPDKYEYEPHIEELGYCEAIKIIKARKLKTNIKIETGELVFVNSFENPELYGFNDDRDYTGPGTGTLLGRDRLMQHLGKKNVGYGQMTNMDVTIYSNGFEVLIGADISEKIYDDKRYFHENHFKMDKYKAYALEMEIKEMERFQEMLLSNEFVRQGNMSLSVWRWMCADKSILRSVGEHVPANRREGISVNVAPGTWSVEHYYDFPYRSNLIYSRLMLKKGIK